jgi:hypothetical protein
MRWTLCVLSLCFLTMAASAATEASGKVIKVLPHYLDLEGRHSLSPSLYERDAYQAVLRQHPEKRSGIRFDVQWKAHGPAETPLKLRAELRGSIRDKRLTQTVLEKEVHPGGWFGHWLSLPLTGEEFKNFGDLTAWRVTLWDGDRLLSEQKSFLW